MVKPEPYVGKVRTVTDIGYNHLLMTASDRLSSFDRHICEIKNKGIILNKLSEWWFKNTSQIIRNHFVSSINEHMFVRKADVIPIEFVVRGYMTGSTSTSIWPMYQSGRRDMYGMVFRDGYEKNQKLDQIILTPTTKGVTDVPITPSQIIEREILTEDQYDFLEQKSIELFKFGQLVAASKGLILVDTKYEFGFVDGEIILVDELHTCDSSRYWREDTYHERFIRGEEPEKLDKDCIRDYVKSVCDPYKDEIPEIPQDLLVRVEKVYQNFYHLFYDELILKEREDGLIENFLYSSLDRMVVILSGSPSDSWHCEKIEKSLRDNHIYSRTHYCSAHKDTRGVLDILEDYEFKGKKIIYITVAGMSNALSGVTTCNSTFPVIACPPFKDAMDMQTNIHSTLQMPSKVPVMTILSPGNVALSVRKIFNLF